MENYRRIVFGLIVGLVATVSGSPDGAKLDDVLKCIPTGDPKLGVNITQSEHDKRQYKYMTLKNKLRIILVSDPTVDRSAAAVSIHAGYSSDPPSLPGLAHFCEHMLFLGTEKYPDEGEFTNFLGQHSGRSNAYTSTEFTLYHFNVKADSLQPALDRFSQFFVAPLFDSNSTDRELHAIDQEYQKNYREDDRRIYYIEKAGSRRGHPYGNFGGGNLKTLKTIPRQKNIDIRKMLLKFYDEYYSANIMTVAVVGKESLKNLTDMVVPMFEKVKNQNTRLTSHVAPYGKKQLGTMLKIPTIREMNRLEMKFQLPDLRCYYRGKPLQYFSQVIGHEGKGSLLSRLKKLGWAHALEAGDRAGLIGFEFFVIRIDLTKRGLERVDDIITLIFQYLKMMKNAGAQEWIHDEMRNLDGIQFQFHDKQFSHAYAQTLAENLHAYEPQHVLDGKFTTGDFMKDKVTELFQYFTPDNFRYYVASNTFKGPWNRRVKYYDTSYSEHRIPQRKLMRWKNVSSNPHLHLPLKNPFIPDPKELKIVVPRENKTVKAVPVIIKDNEMVRVWHKADDTFYLPKSTIKIGIYSPIAIVTPSNLNHLSVFVRLVQDAMIEFGYAAQLAGIRYRIQWIYTGILIDLDGFSSRQNVLLRKILHHVVSIKHRMKEEKFRVAKQKLLEHLNNADVQVPYKQTEDIRNYVVSQTWWNAEERLRYVNELTVDSLKRYIGDFLNNIYIEGMFCGNMLRSNALATFRVAEKILVNKNGGKPMLPMQHLRSKEYNLMEGKKYLFEKRSPIHSFSALQIYFQVGIQTERNNVMSELLYQMIYAQMFDTLRTKEQLGYVVFTGLSRSQSVMGIRVLVQSDKEPSYVDKRVDKFFEWFRNELRNMSEKKFKDYVEATAVRKLEKPKQIWHEAKIYVLEIFRRQYHFRRAEKEVELLRKLKKKDVMEFFKQHIDPASKRRKKLAVVVLGNNATSLVKETKGDWMVINDILQFKTSLPLYRHVMPYNDIPLISHKKSKEKNEL